MFGSSRSSDASRSSVVVSRSRVAPACSSSAGIPSSQSGTIVSGASRCAAMSLGVGTTNQSSRSSWVSQVGALRVPGSAIDWTRPRSGAVESSGRGCRATETFSSAGIATRAAAYGPAGPSAGAGVVPGRALVQACGVRTTLEAAWGGPLPQRSADLPPHLPGIDPDRGRRPRLAARPQGVHTDDFELGHEAEGQAGVDSLHGVKRAGDRGREPLAVGVHGDLEHGPGPDRAGGGGSRVVVGGEPEDRVSQGRWLRLDRRDGRCHGGVVEAQRAEADGLGEHGGLSQGPLRTIRVQPDHGGDGDVTLLDREPVGADQGVLGARHVDLDRHVHPLAPRSVPSSPGWRSSRGLPWPRSQPGPPKCWRRSKFLGLGRRRPTACMNASSATSMVEAGEDVVAWPADLCAGRGGQVRQLGHVVQPDRPCQVLGPRDRKPGRLPHVGLDDTRGSAAHGSGRSARSGCR